MLDSHRRLLPDPLTETAGPRLSPEADPVLPAMRVLIVGASYPPAFKGGGPIRTLAALVDSAPSDVEIAVLSSDRDLGSTERLPVPRNCWTRYLGVKAYYVSADRPRELWKSWMAMRRWRPDVIYLNSFFSPVFSIAPQILGRMHWWRGATMMVAPRGEFNQGALALKARKKKLFLSAYRIFRFAPMVLWHASNDDEAARVSSTLDVEKIVVREDDTLLPPDPRPPPATKPGPLRAVFLARISPIKGLDILLRAIECVEQSVILDVYGPEEDRVYARTCRALATNAAKGATVTFKGPVDAQSVRSVLSCYDLFVLPTAGENFGHSIAEALSVSCPVMCTADTPWTECLESGGGVVVASRSPQAWSASIDQYAAQTPEDRFRLRAISGAAYGRWRSEAKGPHVFNLVRHMIDDSTSPATRMEA